jgi:hypothetical protein
VDAYSLAQPADRRARSPTEAVAYVSDANGWHATADGGSPWRGIGVPCSSRSGQIVTPSGTNDLIVSCLSFRNSCSSFNCGQITYRSHNRGTTWRRWNPPARSGLGTVVLNESSHW